MALPERTTFLIVGAGPSGLACALSLISQGCEDVVVVDAVSQGANTSRAMVIHAATLEALDTVGCADQLIQCGSRVETAHIGDRFSRIVTTDFSYLVPYTRYPFTLLIPQNVTEHVLGEQAKSRGVRVVRPHRVVAIKNNEHEDDILDVSFEDGGIIRAKYVIGADGAKSAVRQLAGIGFADPDGFDEQSLLSRMVLADITISPPPNPPISANEITGTVTPHGIFLLLPLPPSISSGYQLRDQTSEEAVYRIFCSIPPSDDVPPHAPPTPYLQSLMDQFGPVHLSSDISVNPHPVHISNTVWSTRFRTHSAIAGQFFMRFGSNQGGVNGTGGIIFLIGDAAHIHSPAGGQGMNLGLRDAIGLGPVLASHLQGGQSFPSANADKVLQEYASVRYTRAMSVINLTKGIMSTVQAVAGRFGGLYWLIRLLGKISWVRNMMVWRLSGLGAR